MIEYELSIPQPHTHLVEVRMRIPAATEPLEVVLPTWTPGSYLIREFARHIQDFEVHDATGLRLAWRKTSKNVWRIEGASTGSVTVSYRVYANDLTVRTSHVDDTHAFINGTSVFMFTRGRSDESVRLRVVPPEDWRIATSLHETETGVYLAEDYDELVDCPLEIGQHETIAWMQEGIPHRFAIWGANEIDERRLVADTRRIIDVCSTLFGGLPYDRYLFIVHVVPEGRGGLEHRSSTALQIPEAALTDPHYESFLALIAHEFFHVWLAKRIRPAPLGPFDYTAENYTRNLWVVEGFTTYYTDRILLRAGLMTKARYLERLGDSIARLQALPGRRHQSLEESSFDAWIRFYRPDANTPNAQVSYYHKGSLVALVLDLEIRRASDGRRSLDDVLRILWERFGSQDIGFPEEGPGGIQEIIETVHESSLDQLFDDYVRGVTEIEFDRHLDAAGLTLSAEAASGEEKDRAVSHKSDAPEFETAGEEVAESGAEDAAAAGELDGTVPGSSDSTDPMESAEQGSPAERPVPPIVRPGPLETHIGIRARDQKDGRVMITHVLRGTPAYDAGVNAGDELIALAAVGGSLSRMERVTENAAEGEALEITLMRRNRLKSLRLVAVAPAPRFHRIVPAADATPGQVAIREEWLRGARGRD